MLSCRAVLDNYCPSGYYFHMSVCHSCGSVFPEKMEVYRSTECPSCRSDVKVCLNCVFYSPGSHWDCRESIPEAIREKDKANFCDFFMLGGGKSGSGSKDKSDKARSDFNSLFGNE